MSTPEDKTSNPASLSANPDKKVPRNKPHVKPPLADVPFSKFIVYLFLGLLALAGFYLWRFTIWANDAGGYYNLLTGNRPSVEHAVRNAAGDAIKTAAASANSGVGKTKGGVKSFGKKEDVQSQVQRLAESLGISPADLSEAIRPYLDPRAPKPAAGQDQGAAAAAAAAAAAEKQEPTPGLLGVIGEALLD